MSEPMSSDTKEAAWDAWLSGRGGYSIEPRDHKTFLAGYQAASADLATLREAARELLVALRDAEASHDLYTATGEWIDDRNSDEVDGWRPNAVALYLALTRLSELVERES